MDFSFQMLSLTSYIDNRDFFDQNRLYVVTVETYRLTNGDTITAWSYANERKWSNEWAEVIEKTDRALCHEGENWVYTLSGYEDILTGVRVETIIV